ncbi:MAG: glycosyltransferase family 87 protein [Roseiarcus sp.]
MRALMRKCWSGLRDAEWLDAERALAYARILFFFSFAGALIWIALAQGGIDRAGKPLGTDFVSFWTASELALQGHAADVYNIAAHWGAQRALFGDNVAYDAFFYPPPYLLICLLLAALPYFWSLAAWLGVTGYAYWRVLRAFVGAHFDALAILAFPAFLVNAGHGQNGFLSAALIGGGALWLDRRPILAGLCFGALIYKPQLAVMIPIALIASRRWTTFAAAAASAAALIAASWMVWGGAVWRAFLAAAPLARASLERNLVGDEKMQSVFAAVRLLHGPLTLAYALQAATALTAAAALVWLQRRRFRCQAEGPAIVAAALLASPFLLDYDLTLLAIPLAWSVREASRAGFAPGEKSVLVLGYVLPLFSRTLAGAAGLPIAPLAIAAVFAVVLRRGAEASPANCAKALPGGAES